MTYLYKPTGYYRVYKITLLNGRIEFKIQNFSMNFFKCSNEMAFKSLYTISRAVFGKIVHICMTRIIGRNASLTKKLKQPYYKVNE